MNREKKQSKFLLVAKLLKQNLISLHRMVWGTGWKKLIVAIVVTVVISASILYITLEVTSQPRFCNSCHNMKPYYTSWKTSSHKDVTCTDCHFPPGIQSKLKGKFTALSMLVNYFTGVYKRSKPWAEISDESCMRDGCHETRLLTGEVGYKKSIRFDHAPHLDKLRRNKKLRCTSCHSQIVQGSHMTVTEGTCFLCHFKYQETDANIKNCTKCHIPPVAKEGDETPVKYDHKRVLERQIDCEKCHGDMVVGDGSVPRFRCSACHADQEKIRLYDDTQLMHKNHITMHKIECEQCHTSLQHKSVARSESVKPDCHACHPDFHNAQLFLFAGKGGRGLSEHPSAMYEGGLNCQACHLYHESADQFGDKGKFVSADARSCEPCHGTGYKNVLDQWRQDTEKRISRIETVLGEARNILGQYRSHKNYASASQKVSDAEYNYNLVKHGNSIHNIAFAYKLLAKSYDLASEGLTQVGAAQTLPVYDKTAQIVPGECTNCHSGVGRLEKQVFGWTFSHHTHLKGQKLACNRCHSNEAVHGQLIIGKDDCMKCHHKGIDAGKEPVCGTCHDIQTAIYKSKLEYMTVDTPNIMVSDVGCLDCHTDEDDQLRRPDKTVCSKCHEEEYEEMFLEWETEAMGWLKKLREKVRSKNLKKGNPAYDILKILERDGSKGIHNPELYEHLADEALK